MRNSEIFRQMVMPHAESMRITCLRILGDDTEALDALQDTLIKLWQHADELSTQKMWVLTVAGQLTM